MSPTPSTPGSTATGPKTPEGKRRSALNALRHGLTGRVVVLPSEDMNAYYAFCNELMLDLAPQGPLEKQYAQTFCDTQWRLNRARSYEEGLLVLDRMEQRDIHVGHPQADDALMAARAFCDQSRQFDNLSLYEQRLNRTLKESLRQLKELQAERMAARKAALDEAVAERNLYKFKGEPWEVTTAQLGARFVFSSEEIEVEARRQHRRADAENAGFILPRPSTSRRTIPPRVPIELSRATERQRPPQPSHPGQETAAA